VIGAIRFQRCYLDHSFFICHELSKIVVLTVYVDNIQVTESDINGIEKTQKYLNNSL